MYLAYLDESGDTGLKNSPTEYFVLCCVLVHQDQWLTTLDLLKDMRKRIYQKYGISPRHELKASYFKSGRGVFRGLDLEIDERMAIYKGILLCLAKMPIQVFSVAIHKADARARNYDCRVAAWQFTLQRVHNFSKKNNDCSMIFPDEGHGYFIRKLLRKLRRYHTVPGLYGGPPITLNLDRIVEDPIDRTSHESYFTQMADWGAYAAHKSSYVAPAAHVPADGWDKLDGVMLRAVNQNRGGPPAIVRWP